MTNYWTLSRKSKPRILFQIRNALIVLRKMASHRGLQRKAGQCSQRDQMTEVGLETVTRFSRRSAGTALLSLCAIAAGWCLSGAVPAYGSAAAAGSAGAAQAREETEACASGDSLEGITGNSFGISDDSLPENSFEESIETFYRESGSLRDEEILELARAVSSDTDVLYSELEEKDAAAVAAALSSYENAKAAYITARINRKDPEDPGVFCSGWDLQSSYTQLMIGKDASVRELIPRFQVKSCRLKDSTLELSVEEWMTAGYGAPDGKGAVNASAYSYVFTLTLKRGTQGGWTPCGINGTDANFTWLQNGQDPVIESQEAPPALYAVQSDLDLTPSAYAAIRAGSEDGTSAENGSIFAIDETAPVLAAQAVQSESSAGAGTGAQDAQAVDASSKKSYSYSPSKAAAYADKYWKHYNHSYHEYRGVDCANFVSQCLYAGGMPKTSDWYPQSVNWINVMGHIRHFKEYGSFLTAYDSNVRKGNPVYYDWNGDGTYDHVGICVGTNSSGMPVVDAHTNNVYHVPWSMGSRGRRGTIQLKGTESSATAPARSTWERVGTKVYYRGADGKRVKSRFLTIGGRKYYFDADGVRKTGFFKVGTRWYYASPSGGQLLKGWQKIDGKIYYFFQTGKKAYSRITPGRHKLGGSYYYFNSKGIRQVSFILIGTKWYYADKQTGKFITGWRKISGEWYYFDRRTMVKTIGWKTIDGRRCYFDSYGILRKGKHG